MKGNNKKWLFLGSGLLLLTLIACVLVTNLSSKNLQIEGNEQKVITAGSVVKVRNVKPTDNKSYGPANKTLMQLYSSSNFGSITLSNGTKHTRNMYWMIKTDSGTWVYCIELGNPANITTSGSTGTSRPTSTSSSYWSKLDDFQKKSIELTTVYGFPNKIRSEYSNDIQYFATQTLIWEFQQKWRTNYNATPSNTVVYNKFITQNSELKKAYDSIVTDLRNHNKISSFAKAKEADASIITLNYNSSTKKYEATLTDSNGILSNSDVKCPTGFTCTKNGNKLTISTSSISTAKTITLTKKLPSGQSQGMLIVDNNKDQRLILGKAAVANVNGYVKVTTETLGSLVIKKTSEDGIKEGFSFNVTGPNDYNQTFKTDAEGVVTITNLKLGDYKITETDIPERYESNSSQTVTLTQSVSSVTKAFYNTLKNTSSVQILKIDKDTGEPLIGAKLEIKKGLLDVVDSWTTDGNPHTVEEQLDINQTYSLCEIKAPDGYKAVDVCETFKLTSKDQKLVIKFENEKTEFTIKKLDENNKPLEGAHLQILDLSGKVIEDWVTDNTGQKSIEGLILGKTYKLREVSSPEGYVKVSDQVFIPSLTKTSEVMKNYKNEVIISKKASNTNTLIGGAHLKLLNENGSEIESWISENGKTKVIEGLPAGSYTLVEEVAPDGYTKTKDLTFTVSDTKKKIEVTMTDDPTEVIFSKVSATSGDEIGGAHLKVVDSEGKTIEEWVSIEGESHIIKGKLIDGETYTLTETMAPDGYVVSESISFTVGSNDKVVMENKLTETRIFKKDTVSEKNVVGAHLQLLDSDGNIVREWDTTDGEYVITGLLTGVEYTLRETKAPENYLEASEMTFTLSSTEKSRDIIMLDTPIVYVDNTAADASLVVFVVGIILVLGGVGTVIWIKKKNA